jgi:hypothetical protein
LQKRGFHDHANLTNSGKEVILSFALKHTGIIERFDYTSLLMSSQKVTRWLSKNAPQRAVDRIAMPFWVLFATPSLLKHPEIHIFNIRSFFKQ